MLKRLVASLIDEVIAVAIGAAGLAIYEGILRLIGFQMNTSYLAIFSCIALGIANVVYFTVCKKSVGRKLLKV